MLPRLGGLSEVACGESPAHACGAGPAPAVSCALAPGWGFNLKRDGSSIGRVFDTHVTPDRLAAELSAQEARIYRAMLIQTAATIGGTVAILRLLG